MVEVLGDGWSNYGSLQIVIADHRVVDVPEVLVIAVIGVVYLLALHTLEHTVAHIVVEIDALLLEERLVLVRVHEDHISLVLVLRAQQLFEVVVLVVDLLFELVVVDEGVLELVYGYHTIFVEVELPEGVEHLVLWKWVLDFLAHQVELLDAHEALILEREDLEQRFRVEVESLHELDEFLDYFGHVVARVLHFAEEVLPVHVWSVQTQVFENCLNFYFVQVYLAIVHVLLPLLLGNDSAALMVDVNQVIFDWNSFQPDFSIFFKENLDWSWDFGFGIGI